MSNIGKNSSDFFQSDASIEAETRRTLKRSNTLGQPKTLPAKILSLQHLTSPLFPGPSTYLLVTDAGFTCRIVGTDTGKSSAVLKGHSGPVTCAVYMNDLNAGDTFIYSGSWDKTIKKWSLKTKECLLTWTQHTDFVKSLALKHDGSLIASGSSDKNIYLHDLKTDPVSTTVLKGHTRGVEALAFAHDDSLWSAGSDGTLRQWSLDTRTQTASITGHHTSIYTLCIDNTNELWTGSADNQAIRWTCDSDKVTSLPKVDTQFQHTDYVTSVLPILEFGILLTGSRDESLRVWDLASESLIKAVEGHFDTITSIVLIGNTVYTGSLDCTLRSWKLNELIDPKIVLSLSNDQKSNASVPASSVALTIEEEDELADLMGDD